MAKPQPKPQQQQQGQEKKPSYLEMLKGMKEAVKEGPVGQALQAVKDSPLGQAVEVARAISDSPGAAAIHGFVRQGTKEFAQNVLPAFPDSPRAVEEPGVMGNPTPQLITAQIKGAEVENDGVPGSGAGSAHAPARMSMADLRQYADEKAREADLRMEKGREMEGPEMEM